MFIWGGWGVGKRHIILISDVTHFKYVTTDIDCISVWLVVASFKLNRG